MAVQVIALPMAAAAAASQAGASDSNTAAAAGGLPVRVEVEKNLLNCRLKAVTAYFGRLAGPGHDPP